MCTPIAAIGKTCWWIPWYLLRTQSIKYWSGRIILAFEGLMQCWTLAFLKWYGWEKNATYCLKIVGWYSCHHTVKWLTASKSCVWRAVGVLENHLFPLFDRFVEFRCNESPIFKYWNMLLDAADVTLLSIRTGHERNLNMNLHTVHKIITCYFAANASKVPVGFSISVGYVTIFWHYQDSIWGWSFFCRTGSLSFSGV